MKKEEFEKWADKVGWVYIHGKAGDRTTGGRTKLYDECWMTPEGRNMYITYRDDEVEITKGEYK